MNYLNEIEKVFNHQLETGNLGRDQIGYSDGYKGLIAVIAVDIRGYQEICKREAVENVTKIVQAYSSVIIKIGKNHKNFLFASLNGDEVILVYKLTCGDCREKVINICNEIDTNFRDSFTQSFRSRFGWEIRFGIGLAIADQQIVAKYGEKYSSEENELTVFGSAINLAHRRAKGHDRLNMG